LHDFQRANSACQLSKAGAAYPRPFNQAGGRIDPGDNEKLS
jgi:hypothetical protein